MEDLLASLQAILVPLLFVMIGIQAKLEVCADPHLLSAAVGILLAAIAGQPVSGLAARDAKARLVIGIGMLPRGEVGVVFAAVAKVLGAIGTGPFSAIVRIVMVTTLMAPPLLRWAYRCAPEAACSR